MRKQATGVRLHTIRAKIIVIVLSISIVALLLSAVATYWGISRIRTTVLQSSKLFGEVAAENSQTALIEQATNNLLKEAGAKAVLAEERLGGIRQQVRLTAAYIAPIWSGEITVSGRVPESAKRMMQYTSLPSMNEELREEQMARAVQIQQLLEPVYLENANISSIYFATAEGLMVIYDDKPAGTYEKLIRHGYNFQTREWYQDAVGNGVSFTSTYLDMFGRLMTTCSAPVYMSYGTFAGVLGIDVLIEDINRAIVSGQVGENGYAILIDEDGAVISSPTLSTNADGSYESINLLQNPDFAPAVADMITGARNIKSIKTDGKDVFFAYAPVPAAGWSLGLVLPQAEVVAPAAESYHSILTLATEVVGSISGTTRMLLIVFVGVFTALIVFVLATTRVLSGKLTAPIHQLIEEVGEISGGDLERRIDVHTGDEMEHLGKAFNSMTDSLRKHIAELTAITAEKERIETELNVAMHIQASMLPCTFPPFPERDEFDIYATMDPAKEVGGDFYDFFLIDNDHLAITIADVSGKGVPAALFMAIAKTLMKDHAQAGTPLEKMFFDVNQRLCESNDEGMFVTAWMGVLELSTGHIKYVNAGHTAPMIRSANGAFTYLKSDPGFVLAGLEGMQYEQGELTLERGGALYLYTDGVTEAINLQEELYGEQRLLDEVNRHCNGSLIQLLVAVKQDMNHFVGKAAQFDDITMLALSYKGKEKVGATL